MCCLCSGQNRTEFKKIKIFEAFVVLRNKKPEIFDENKYNGELDIYAEDIAERRLF